MMGFRLFVGNLPYDTTEDEIRGHFSPVGNLSYVSIPLDRETGKKRGFAFVEFADAERAQEAIRQFNNQPFKGRPLARVPGADFGDPDALDGSRGDRPSRKNFGPDAKPARSRAQKFKPESGK